MKMLLNLLLLMVTTTIITLSITLKPTTPQSLVLLTSYKTFGKSMEKIEISEAVTFSKDLREIPDSGLLFSCYGNLCTQKSKNQEQPLKYKI